jgi:methyl-accepting chemotaxis protein
VQLKTLAIPDPRSIAMIGFKKSAHALSAQDSAGMADAVNRVQAVIEFGLDGTIQHANENFLKAMGYTLEEIRGKHHAMFVDPAYRNSPQYKSFWEKLGRGDFDAGQYKRLAKGGREVWLQASYNPIFDGNGKPVKVIKFATDITQQKLRDADYQGQIASIGKAQAVIEFTLDGKIINANDNFLKTLGYTLDEIKGRHHSMFVDANDRDSAEYKAFWDKLGRGEYDAAQYKRVAKDGHDVWIQASYNPIMDFNGKPFKVVKYATDVTANVKASQALQRAVSEVQQVVDAAKDNDLTGRVPLAGKTGEIAMLCSGVNGLIDTMSAVIRRVKESVREISSASAEISTSTSDLSQRTEEQAASLEETSSSMEEMAATVNKNAENAQQANQSAASTQQVADRGGEVVAKAVDAMARIEESSRKISDIIGVIDEIARQTNLLALNAAVEAARAGEAGRGFAVVASEVRSLAQRSSQAAKDIKDLITNSNSQVKDGVDLVNKAGTALTEIVESIKKVAGVVSEIASASAEQAAGIEQVNKAITQMDEVTQQNSALVEENAAAAKTLEQQAQTMSDEVSAFQVDDAAASAEAVAVAERQRPSSKPALKAGASKTAAERKIHPKAPKANGAEGKLAEAGVGASKTSTGTPRRNPVGRMQATVAAAMATPMADPEWQEF